MIDDPRALLIGEHPWSFLLEVLLRTGLMFFLVLGLFMLTGKKEVRQFSVLELIVIIGLGSALGDPMLHADTPLLPAIVTIAAVLFLYRAVNAWTNRWQWVGRIVEGEVRTVLINGLIDHEALRKEGLSVQEFYGDLRVHHVEHLGQVKAAHLEVDGELSVFFLSDVELRPGLPIAPSALVRSVAANSIGPGPISCTHCGHTTDSAPAQGKCPHCAHDKWLRSMSSPRVE